MREPRVPVRTTPDGRLRGYVRFVALGDSLTFGIGDPTASGHRGWARILANAISHDHDVSFLNVARPGATVADAASQQLGQALAHRAHICSLIVGLNDTMRSDWDPTRLRSQLLRIGDELTDGGTLLLTARFHDHARVFRLPGRLGRALTGHIRSLNEIYDEVHDRFGGIRVDLAAHPGVYDRDFWSIDRLHPSELGHRALALECAAHLDDRGLFFQPPDLALDGIAQSRSRELRWLVGKGTPWVARRARDLVPAAARSLLRRWSRPGSQVVTPVELQGRLTSLAQRTSTQRR